jgi:hypothetical protein
MFLCIGEAVDALELTGLLLQIKSQIFFFSVTLNFSFLVSGTGL